MKSKIQITIVLLIGFTHCSIQKDIVYEKPCSTKYPVILVHGLGLRDNIKAVKYWSGLPKILEKKGAQVFLANQDAFNSHIENAIKLRERILKILDKTKATKVNLIAHSKGGLESRYMISKLGMANQVASLTTLASPHRGSFLADTVISWLSNKGWLDNVINFINNYARFLGDEKPDAFSAANNLTVRHMNHFNESVPNAKQVYYQSYGGTVTEEYPFWKIRFQYKILQKAQGENDCAVSKDSYQWGYFKGVVKSGQDFGVSHFDIVGMKFVSKQSTFDAEGFIVEIVKGLKEQGF